MTDTLERGRWTVAKDGRTRSAVARAWRADRPWTRWRGRECTVDRLTVDLLVSGYRFAGRRPTKREYQVATWRLTGTGRSGEAIAALLGIDYRTLLRYQGDRARLRSQRTARRLADVKRRAYERGRRT